MKTLEQTISSTLERLDDSEAGVYSRDETAVYIQDGYDRVCRRSKCLFDIHYVENLPAVANCSSAEEFEMAKQIPGLILTGIRHFTREVDRDIAPPGSIGPAGVSTHAQLALLDLIPGVESKANPVGQLTRGYVEIERVSHDGIALYPEFSYGASRQLDSRYEYSGGDPDWFIVDKDGLFTLRRFPTGDGAAVYSEVTGHYGIETSDSDYTGEIVGNWGGMTLDTEEFPAGGPWGSPTRTHPDLNNTRVELYRLGRELRSYGFEIPDNYVRYVEFWACSRALRREGPSQDLELADHYKDRFELGVDRLRERVRRVQTEYTGRIGHGARQDRVSPLAISLPWNYGRSRRRSGRY